MNNLEKLRLLLKISSIIGVVQSLGWLVISILCIVFYYFPPKFTEEDVSKNYTSLLSYILFSTYLDSKSEKDYGDGYGYILIPSKFRYVCFTSAILSGLWLIFSVSGIVAFAQKKKEYLHAIILGALFLIVSIFDGIIFVLILLQYLHYGFDDDILKFDIASKQASGIVMSIVARGYVLWIINVIIGTYLILVYSKIRNSPPILRLETNIPRPKIETNFYQWDDNKSQSKNYGNSPPPLGQFSNNFHDTRNFTRNYDGFGNDRY